MNARVQNAVTGRLSLRPPQAESLSKLVCALEAAPSLLAALRNGRSDTPVIGASHARPPTSTSPIVSELLI